MLLVLSDAVVSFINKISITTTSSSLGSQWFWNTGAVAVAAQECLRHLTSKTGSRIAPKKCSNFRRGQKQTLEIMSWIHYDKFIVHEFTQPIVGLFLKQPSAKCCLDQESGVPAWVVDVGELEGGFSVGILQQAEVLTQEETWQCYHGSYMWFKLTENPKKELSDTGNPVFWDARRGRRDCSSVASWVFFHFFFFMCSNFRSFDSQWLADYWLLKTWRISFDLQKQQNLTWLRQEPQAVPSSEAGKCCLWEEWFRRFYYLGLTYDWLRAHDSPSKMWLSQEVSL